ncbi:MAG: Ribosomal silencing factor RsfS [Pelotomaculum thermopropionicum]|uniref:Ribosomal silencing factor RsfS n=1 Tax=Pelotomaculum thermopropionicum TaxID=110500 RepID=A0A101HQM9_9FIRM|nr:MAG: Ribosomal silencing factor RsfS [Pelotomaculum thermopropionicum]
MNLLPEPDSISSIIEILQDKQAEDISIIDLSSESTITDFFVMATGNSDVHMRSVSGYVTDTLDKMGIPYRIEGETSPKWILIDAGDIIINIFSREGRGFYRLESIWASAKTTRLN